MRSASSFRTAFARYVATFLASTLAGLVMVGGFNAVVDPYLVIGAPRIAGFNAIKPAANTHTALAKSHLFARAHPRGLMLGDSKVDIGLDPDSLDWPDDARPVFNHGLPGIGLETIRDILQDDLQAAPIRRVLLLIDMQTLLAPPLPLLPTDLPPAPAATVPFVGDLVASTLSLDALQSSIATILAQRRTPVSDLSDLGATSEGGFEGLVGTIGEHALFADKDAELARRFTRLAAYLRDHPDAGDHRLDIIASAISLCRAHGAALDLAIAPYHKDYLDLVVKAGLWPRYQQAKAALAELVAASPGVRLYDFLLTDPITSDQVPPPGDRTTATAWFWEPSHFKKRLGAKILAVIYRASPGYGFNLTR